MTKEDSTSEQKCVKCGHGGEMRNGVCQHFYDNTIRRNYCMCTCSFSEAAACTNEAHKGYGQTGCLDCAFEMNEQKDSPASEGIPERIKVVIRAATTDDWIGVAYCKDYAGDPSTIHEFVNVPSLDEAAVRRAAEKIEDRWITVQKNEGESHREAYLRTVADVAEIISTELASRKVITTPLTDRAEQNTLGEPKPNTAPADVERVLAAETDGQPSLLPRVLNAMREAGVGCNTWEHDTECLCLQEGLADFIAHSLDASGYVRGLRIAARICNDIASHRRAQSLLYKTSAPGRYARLDNEAHGASDSAEAIRALASQHSLQNQESENDDQS